MRQTRREWFGTTVTGIGYGLFAGCSSLAAPLPPIPPSVYRCPDKPAVAVAEGASGRVAAKDRDSRLTLWDAAGKLVPLTHREGRLTVGFTFDDTGRRLFEVGCSSGEGADFWGDLVARDAATGREERRFVAPGLPVSRRVEFIPPRTVAVAGCDGRLHRWDAETGSLRASCRLHERSFCLAASPDQSLIVTAGYDGIGVWEAGSLRRVRSVALTGYVFTHLSFSPDGRSVAAADHLPRPTEQDPLLLMLVEPATGSSRRLATCWEGLRFKGIAFTRSGDAVLAADHLGGLCRHPIPWGRPGDFKDLGGTPNALCPTADGSGILVAFEDGMIRRVATPE